MTGTGSVTPSNISLWMDSVAEQIRPRSPLPGDIDVDVAILGAGYTGLWTAYYLLESNPGLKIALIEKEFAGFGASGRNGGWCSALFAASRDAIAKETDRTAALATHSAMIETIDEVGRVSEREGIDCHFRKGGTLQLATSPAHVERVRESIDEDRSWGLGVEESVWLSPADAQERIRVPTCYGARFTPHCAAIHPARLVVGLATTIEKKGAVIYERTTGTEVEPGRLHTDRGIVSAGTIVRATEAYTSQLPGMRRRVVPLYSLMIATEPLGPDVWDRIGWEGRETLHDGRHLIIYAQRTEDGRIALGGRGAPYHFGSRIDSGFDSEPAVFDALIDVLHELFPEAARAEITHRWGGVIGVPRDWFSSVGFSPREGIAWAGGYVGDGVSTTNLAGRTLRDLILGNDSELTRLPWVNHRSRSWEPEPLRWLGINTMLKGMARADKYEERTKRPSRSADRMKKLLGL